MFYAAIHAPSGNAPQNCVWRAQILIPLDWLIAFMQQANGPIVRSFDLSAYNRTGDRVVITTDAPPYGFGGVLQINERIVSYFADTLQPHDKVVLGITAEPTSADQQVLEAFSILLALREWSKHWLHKRVQLCTRSDNIASLALCCKMQPHSERMGIVAREMALDISMSAYAPDDVKPVPGIANTAADILRLLQPGFNKALPLYRIRTATISARCVHRRGGAVLHAPHKTCKGGSTAS